MNDPHSPSVASNLNRRLSSIGQSPKLLWGLVLLGVALRLGQYLFNRSLWLDEVNLADNLLSRDFSELWLPLDGGQYAPIGFLVVIKLIIGIFGSSEYAFRLFSLLSGLVGLWLFALLARRLLPAVAAIPAVLLFAVSDQLIYYSSELKPYSTDVAATTLVLWLALRHEGVLTNRRAAGTFALVGAALLWFSFPMLLLLPVVGGLCLSMALLRRDRPALVNTIGIGFVWCLSLAALYAFSLRDNSVDPFVRNFWQEADAFVPLTTQAPGWIFSATVDLFNWDHHWIPILSWVLAAIGCVALGLRRSPLCVLAIGCLILTLFASLLERYPFQRRLLLYAWPLILLALGEGMRIIGAVVRRTQWLTAIALLAVCLGPTAFAFDKLVHPRQRQEIRPLVDYLMAHREGGDEIYLFYATLAQFRYYAKRQGLQTGDYILGSFDPNDWPQEVGRLRGQPRVWFVFISPRKQQRVSGHTKLFLNTLHGIGQELDHFQSVPFDAILFDLTAPPGN